VRIRNSKDRYVGVAILFGAIVFGAYAQGHRMRYHTVTSSNGRLSLVRASTTLRTEAAVSIEVQGDQRVIRANGIPRHKTGAFPNAGNPNSVSAQRYTYSVPLRPRVQSRATPLRLGAFGIALNGVPFDPGAAEFYLGNPQNGWQYEALSGAVTLGLDASHAHVQPTGAYHYHGLPTLLLKELGASTREHSPLIGWAADGFPIYALRGYVDAKNAASGVRVLRPGYRLKSGQRPSGSDQPGGRYDGTFVQDYEYAEGVGDLDACNGRFCVTPEFPDGTYAYFLTESWPVIPRMFRASPSSDFQKRGRGAARSGDRQHPHGDRHSNSDHPPRR